ncbi:hypothetical protein J6590_087661 [Homalodisca vitripennis]|nr:hypothetical protein J6590_087661 [Homalodisca vitripennis]
MGSEEGLCCLRHVPWAIVYRSRVKETIVKADYPVDDNNGSADYRSDNCLSHIHDNQSSKYPRANAVIISRVHL